jgi:hypothetical protein
MWEPRRLTARLASAAYYRDSFAVSTLFYWQILIPLLLTLVPGLFSTAVSCAVRKAEAKALRLSCTDPCSLDLGTGWN